MVHGKLPMVEDSLRAVDVMGQNKLLFLFVVLDSLAMTHAKALWTCALNDKVHTDAQ